MKKKILTSITIALLSLSLSACNPVASKFYGDYILNVQNFGPNNEALKYYVHYTEKEKPKVNNENPYDKTYWEYSVFLYSLEDDTDTRIMEWDSDLKMDATFAGDFLRSENGEVLLSMGYYKEDIFKDANGNEIDVSGAVDKDDPHPVITFHYNLSTGKISCTEYVYVKPEYLPENAGMSLTTTYIPMEIDGKYIFISKKYGYDEIYYSEEYEDMFGEEHIIAEYLTDKSGVYEKQAYYDKDEKAVYFAVTGLKGFFTGPRNYETPDDASLSEVKNDTLLRFDPDTKKCEEVLKLRGGYSRIIGVHSGEAYIWSKNTIYKINLENKQKTTLTHLNLLPGKRKLSFNWINDELMVFDNTDNRLIAFIKE